MDENHFKTILRTIGEPDTLYRFVIFVLNIIFEKKVNKDCIYL